mmetsp:Transcript_30184/g.92321  ORF Transcript_30184/g.92321 Transcript_30184/m.92321 type:complete len:219 (+) Transcript_30184:708-1364(+)
MSILAPRLLDGELEPDPRVRRLREHHFVPRPQVGRFFENAARRRTELLLRLLSVGCHGSRVRRAEAEAAVHGRRPFSSRRRLRRSARRREERGGALLRCGVVFLARAAGAHALLALLADGDVFVNHQRGALEALAVVGARDGAARGEDGRRQAIVGRPVLHFVRHRRRRHFVRHHEPPLLQRRRLLPVVQQRRPLRRIFALLSRTRRRLLFPREGLAR